MQTKSLKQSKPYSICLRLTEKEVKYLEKLKNQNYLKSIPEAARLLIDDYVREIETIERSFYF